MRINWKDYNPLCVCCKKPLAYVQSVIAELKEDGENSIHGTVNELIDSGNKYRVSGYLETVLAHAPEYKEVVSKYLVLV